jgi:flagellar biosynthesis/type III secretory pathway chaperone
LNNQLENLLAEKEQLQKSIIENENIFKDFIKKEKQYLSDLKQQIQNVCKHSDTYKTTEYDYHHSVEWTTEYCEVCHKKLRKY